MAYFNLISLIISLFWCFMGVLVVGVWVWAYGRVGVAAIWGYVLVRSRRSGQGQWR